MLPSEAAASEDGKPREQSLGIVFADASQVKRVSEPSAKQCGEGHESRGTRRLRTLLDQPSTHESIWLTRDARNT